MNTTKIVLILLGVWFIFSAIYIGYNFYNNIKLDVAEKSYITGKSDTLSVIIKKAKNCELVNIGTEDKSVQLVNVKCLKENSNNISSGNNSDKIDKTPIKNPQDNENITGD